MTSATSSALAHIPVLLRETLQALNIQTSGLYIDATYGRGGHTKAILEQLDSDGCLVAMDRDPEAVRNARSVLRQDPRCHVVHGTLHTIDTHIEALRLNRKANGVLADLGVSSPQFDDPQRGFSFNADGPLDMRMDTTAGLDAGSWLSRVEEAELSAVLKEYGEERYARRIARAVVELRQTEPLTRTRQLADLVSAVVPSRERNKHPATRTFQAIRMRINAELDQLSVFLPKAVKLLADRGRLAVISFHSLEDRMVKRFIREQARGETYPAQVPITAAQVKPLLRVVGKPRRPSPQEIEHNPRARSAVLRVAERTEHCHA